MKEYIKYLEDAEDMLWVHAARTFEYPNEFLDRGKAIRAKINPENLPNP